MSYRSQSYSSRSVSSSSARSLSSSSPFSLSGGRQLIGAGQTRISTGSLKARAPSVYGGAGGEGTRISQSIFSTGTMVPYGESAVITNEKVTMQNLNDRLASYLEKVRSLESANRKLELQIREFYEKRAPSSTKDFTGFFATITDLRAQILRRLKENQGIILQMDNAQLAAEDFRIKYEAELNMHNAVVADVTRLRGVRDGLTLSISDAEVQIEALKEELVYMKNNHEEEMRLLRVQQSGQVNVEVDSTESVDLQKVLEELREQYEAMTVKNKQELEKWYKSKTEILQTGIYEKEQEVKTYNAELSELKRTYQSLEISRQSAIAGIECLQQNLEEVRCRYGLQLSQMQLRINALEEELQQLKVSIQQQQAEYKLLLDIKMRLELEIAEYRRLLEGEVKYEEKKAVIIREVEVPKQHIERRVRTIVEEIVDGQVVSSSVDVEVENIQ